jgi:hypothetical protein
MRSMRGGLERYVTAAPTCVETTYHLGQIVLVCTVVAMQF